MTPSLRKQFPPGSGEIRTLLARKIHVTPGVLRHVSASVQQALDTPWQGALALARHLIRLPKEALAWWAQEPPGHILLVAEEPAYLTVDDQGRAAVVHVPLAWVVQAPQQALSWALMPLDHLLGCRGAVDGPWLSDGGGVTPAWQTVGRQIARLFPLGYGLTPEAQADPHRYLAEAWAAALLAPRSLNTADPKLYRVLRTSLLAPGFWRRALPRAKEDV